MSISANRNNGENMNTRIIALGCALTSAACVTTTETRPVQHPAAAASATNSTPRESIETSGPIVTPTTEVVPSNSQQASRSYAKTSSQGTIIRSEPRANIRLQNAEPTQTTTSQGATIRREQSEPRTANTLISSREPSRANADNTQINSRDRGETLTPMDQGNSRAETAITASIRRGLMRDDTLSFNAKNAKVITIGSKVTLRGPVRDAQEKSAIEAIAAQTAGVTEVVNQLEINK